MASVIWWIRRDLRTKDNTALGYAIKFGYHVIPVYILDPNLASKLSKGKEDFLFFALNGLINELGKFDAKLHIFKGEPLNVFRSLSISNPFVCIVAEKDYGPYAKRRDQLISREFQVEFVDGLTIHPVNAIHKADGSPYTIFTPFSRTWLNLPLPEIPIYDIKTAIFDSSNIPGEIAIPKQDAGSYLSETKAKEELHLFLDKKIFAYGDSRNIMGIEGTSKLSAYFHFGLLSSRYAALQAFSVIENAKPSKDAASARQWLNELIWRDFYYSILDTFPFVLKQAFRQKMSQFSWVTNDDHLNAWQQGLTGYPIVDAAMRELLNTSWMHNRARMIAASFLTKDLLINWQIGEKWFMQNLIDGDAACNNGGWQWSAGTGTDAAPFFRIFSPTLQSKKYDPEGTYIRKWMPEIARLPNNFIHEPWTLPIDLQSRFKFLPGKHYPLPIIDHQFARDRALLAFRNLAK